MPVATRNATRRARSQTVYARPEPKAAIKVISKSLSQRAFGKALSEPVSKPLPQSTTSALSKVVAKSQSKPTARASKRTPHEDAEATATWETQQTEIAKKMVSIGVFSVFMRPHSASPFSVWSGRPSSSGIPRARPSALTTFHAQVNCLLPPTAFTDGHSQINICSTTPDVTASHFAFPTTGAKLSAILTSTTSETSRMNTFRTPSSARTSHG